MIGIVLHILSSVSLRRIRDRVAEALCICRRLRSLAVIGLELLAFDPVDDLSGSLADALATFNEPRRTSPLLIAGDIAGRPGRMGREGEEQGSPILPRADRWGDFCENVNNSGVSDV